VTRIPREAPSAAMVRAIEANELERFAYLSRFPGGELHHGSQLTYFLTGIPYLLFNGILSARLPPDDLDERIARALAPFASRKLPMFWMTGPSTQPADLGQRLLAAGLSDAGALVGMAADLMSVHEVGSAPPDLSIERVRDLRALERWVGAFRAGFGYPADVGRSFLAVFAGLGLGARSPLTHYLGLLEGEPVATASAFLGAGVVGIYSVATLPAWRRRGIGAAMTLAPLRAAQSRGYQIGVLHAEPAGLSVYRRVGFREYCTLHPYLWSPGERDGMQPSHNLPPRAAL
jgi:ribosomal protein S18 acetylase RimI-like enzyme